MKPSLSALPKFLCITAQSGAGKDTTTEILRNYCEKTGCSIHVFSSGDLIREYCKGDSDHAREIKMINDSGGRAPEAFVGDLLREYLKKPELAAYDHIILNGSPRFKSQCDLLYSIAKENGWSFTILELIAPDIICAIRLFKRTLEDKRLELTTKGYPDEAKILNKLSWWETDGPSIIARAKELGVYKSIDNSETDLENIELKNNLTTMFS